MDHAVTPLKPARELETIEPAPCTATMEGRIDPVNHQPRRLLGKTSCEAFFSGKLSVANHDRRRRKEGSEITDTEGSRIIETIGDDGDMMRATAWRVFVKNWLRKNGVITATSGGRVLPDFSRIRTQH